MLRSVKGQNKTPGEELYKTVKGRKESLNWWLKESQQWDSPAGQHCLIKWESHRTWRVNVVQLLVQCILRPVVSYKHPLSVAIHEMDSKHSLPARQPCKLPSCTEMQKRRKRGLKYAAVWELSVREGALGLAASSWWDFSTNWVNATYPCTSILPRMGIRSQSRDSGPFLIKIIDFHYEDELPPMRRKVVVKNEKGTISWHWQSHQLLAFFLHNFWGCFLKGDEKPAPTILR